MGIFQRNGTPVERALVQSLVDFLAYRGPDARAIWSEGSVGLGHAMLRTTREAREEKQPANLEARFWITADARLDGRTELLGELQQSGREVIPGLSDAELILHAYAAWGAPCVEHLRGDFSFVVWDAQKKQLFCARDQLGIKPFYYAELEKAFVFSNTLNCVRLHPHVSAELNEAAIGDFLLFGLNYDQATTAFRDIQRLPPAHWLIISPRELHIKRYWAPPTDGRIRYSRAEEYIEHFQELLRGAVADRLRTERIGILLSGGLDSSSVAAVAQETISKSGERGEIRGYTSVYESLIPDRDGDYARQAGEFLRIPIKFMAMDKVQLFEGCDDPDLSWPEPLDDPLFANFFESSRIISADCRVLLSGEGIDNLMDFQMWPYANDLWRRWEWQRLLTETANYLWVRPFPWRGIRAKFLGLVGKAPDRPVFPQWLAGDFVKRNNLRERWKEWGEHPKLTRAHPILPAAHASLDLPQWTSMFELENAGVAQEPLEVRYPFLDLRLVNYLLGLPPFPWFFQKMLLREAMVGRLPETVRMRPKTPLQSDPLLAQFRRTGAERVKQANWSKDLERFIECSAVAPPHDKMNGEEMSCSLRPYCLNIWLQSARRVRYNWHAETSNG